MDQQEAKSRRGWTSVMSKTFGDEQEARQALAWLINENWSDGSLKTNWDAELQGKLLKNAKTEEEIQAVKTGIEKMRVDIKSGELNNEILELEKELQTNFGIDKNSPVWLKMLGRLIIKYFK